MAYTKHFNLLEMPSGAVDWPAVINDLLAKLEAGRTLKLTAGEALTKGKAFYVGGDGKAWKADGTTHKARGIWQSASTATGVDGYGQIDGTMTTGSGWTAGDNIYATTGGALTQTVNGDPIGYALAASEIVIKP